MPDPNAVKYGKRPNHNAGDGSYLEVESYLERTLRDPDSLKFDGCTDVRLHNQQGWLVGCTYRAKNGFGGYTRQANWFTIRGGQVIAMHEAGAFKE